MRTLLALLVVAVASAACSSPSPAQPIPSSTAVALSTPTPVLTPRSSDPRIPPEALKYRRQIIKSWQRSFGLDESPATAFAQIHQESRFRAEAKSPVGASGLGQFMPATAAWINDMLPADQRCVDKNGCPTDPNWAIAATCEFDRRLFFVYGKITSVISDRWGFALAAYNAGEGSVRRERETCTHMGACKSDRWFEHTENACSRLPSNCTETREYVRVIMLKWKPMYQQWLSL